MTIFVEQCSLGNPAGPAVAIKDTIDIAGLATRAGCQALAEAPPATRHADVVEKVLAAGCHIVGKTTLHELAFGVSGINDWAGTPTNPRYPDLIPGGSSSGSAAAVAAGLVDFALGTDTGGSVRIPAACCGVWGLKPTFGRVSRAGVMPAYTTLDCVGPFAASARQLQKAMSIIDPSFKPVTADRLKIGVVAVEAAAFIGQAIDIALGCSGFALQAVSLAGMEAAFDAGLTIINAETWAACRNYMDKDGVDKDGVEKDGVEKRRVGADVAQRLIAASKTTGADVLAAEAVRRRFIAEVDGLLGRVDVLVLPTLADRPPTLTEARTNRSAVALTRFVRPFNLSGHPALTMPLNMPLTMAQYAPGPTPIGLQLVGRKGDDALVCAAGAALAAALG